MGTTGTIMGCSRYFKEQNPAIRIIGCQRRKARRFPAYASGRKLICQKIFEASRVDQVENVSQGHAEEMTRRLAREEGILPGFPPAAHWRWLCASQARSKTR